MHPRIFGIIKSYGLLLAISFLLGTWLSVRRGRRHGIVADTILDVVFAVLIASIIGVRVVYVATHLAEFDPWYRVFFIWDGGLTLYGGIAAAIAAVWWLARRRGIPFLRIADILAPGVALGIGITRIGCFLAGCCFGRPTGGSLGVVFPAGSPAWRCYGAGVAVQPSQIYSSLGGFAIFVLLLIWERRSAPLGATFFRFLLLYGVQRFLVDFTRHYAVDQIWGGLSNNQWVSVGLILLGTIALLRIHRGDVAGG
jgi:phosphatidylglycerol:prolipoprotein diacylglycerol transferase